jgi:hypothetical protein
MAAKSLWRCDGRRSSATGVWGPPVSTLNSLAKLVVLCLVLAGCSSLGWVDRYDPSIVAEVNAYHVKTLAFVAVSENDAGLPAGLASSDRSKTFYAEQGAVLTNLVVRADAANRGRPCLINAFKALLPELAEEMGASAVDALSCTGIILRVLQLAHAGLEERHQIEGYLRPPASTDALADINKAVLTTLQHEDEKN